MEIDEKGNNYCFACGKDNAHGLKLTFKHDEANSKVISTPVVAGKYDGWKGAAHGGIIATLLDEGMVYAALAQSKALVATAKMDIRFKKPVPTDKEIILEGEVLKSGKRLISAVSRILCNGVILAECIGSLVVVATVEDIYDSNNHLAFIK